MLGSGKNGRSLVVLLVCGTRGCRVGVGGRATFTMRMRGIIAAGEATLLVDHMCKFCGYAFRKTGAGLANRKRFRLVQGLGNLGLLELRSPRSKP